MQGPASISVARLRVAKSRITTLFFDIRQDPRSGLATFCRGGTGLRRQVPRYSALAPLCGNWQGMDTLIPEFGYLPVACTCCAATCFHGVELSQGQALKSTDVGAHMTVLSTTSYIYPQSRTMLAAGQPSSVRHNVICSLGIESHT